MDTIITFHKQHPSFLDLSWVLRARVMDKKNPQENLKCLYLEDGRWIATDGHGMHVWDSGMGFPNGVYRVITATASQIIPQLTEDFQFLRVWDVWPAHRPIASDRISFDGDIQSLSACAATVIRMLPDGLTVNLAYLRALGGFSWKVHLCPTRYRVFGEEIVSMEGIPLTFESDDRDKVAIVMPLRP